MSKLSAAIQKAMGMKKPRAEDMEDDEVVAEDDLENDTDAENNDEEVVAEDGDEEVVAEDDDEEVVAEDDEEKPAAKARAKKPSADTLRERKRCVAIMTHANADAQPDLAANLLVKGTPKADALDMLNSVSASSSKGGKLSSRYASSQGDKRPGVDGKGANKPGSLTATLAARKAARTKKGN